MIEKWKSVSVDDNYMVSCLGRIKRVKRDGKVLKDFSGRRGYRRVCLSRGDNQGTKYVSALVAKAFVGDRPTGKQINHKDGIKANNSYTNLEYVTSKENIHHAKQMGFMFHGERHPMAKLNWQNVREIRRFYSMRLFNGKELARKYDIGSSTCYDILNRRIWAEEIK